MWKYRGPEESTLFARRLLFVRIAFLQAVRAGVRSGARVTQRRRAILDVLATCLGALCSPSGDSDYFYAPYKIQTAHW